MDSLNLVCSVLEKNQLDQKQYNRMRNLHNDLKENYGLEALQLLQIWEKGVKGECN